MADAPKPPAPGSGETDDIDSLLKAIEETQKEPRPGTGPARPPAKAPPAAPAGGPPGRPVPADDEITKLLAAAAATPAPASTPAAPPPGALQKPAFPAVDAAGGGAPAGGLDLLKDVNLHVKVELGRCRLRVKDILQLGSGSVVPLDKLAGDPLDVYVNGRLVARGEVLVLKDNFCIRITEIVSPTP